jgi:hypothetical protein
MLTVRKALAELETLGFGYLPMSTYFRYAMIIRAPFLMVDG